LAHRDVASVAPLRLAQVPLRNIDNRNRETILTIGIDLDAPAVNLAAIKADVTGLRIPGNVLFDAKSQPFFGNVPAHIRRDGRATIELAYDGDLVQPKLTAVGTHALGGTIVFPGTLLASSHTLASVSRLPVDRLNIGIIALKDGANPEQVRNDLATMLPPDVKVFTKAGFVEHEKAYWKTETPIGFLFDFGALIGFFISAIYTYQVLYQIVEENLPQYALLKSMGYPNEFFVVLVVTTAATLAATALPAAVVLGAVVYAICAKATMLDVQLSVVRVASVSAMMIGLSVASALIAGRRLSRVEPASLL
jgi:putative ABC transport system permease protein